MKKIIIIIGALILIFLFYIIIGGLNLEKLQNLSIGEVNISKVNNINYKFKCPNPSAINFSIEVIDNSGQFESSEFNSSLVFSISIKDGSNIIYNELFTKDNLIIGNWHNPNTSIIAMPKNRSELDRKLKKGREYELEVEVISPDEIYENNKAILYINYVDVSWEYIFKK